MLKKKRPQQTSVQLLKSVQTCVGCVGMLLETTLLIFLPAALTACGTHRYMSISKQWHRPLSSLQQPQTHVHEQTTTQTTTQTAVVSTAATDTRPWTHNDTDRCRLYSSHRHTSMNRQRHRPRHRPLLSLQQPQIWQKRAYINKSLN